MTLVIYDSMESYAREMVRYLSQKNSTLSAAAFFEKEALMTFCEKENPDILLAEEHLADDEIRQLACGCVALLTENVPESSAGCGTDGEPARISRYQSADEILAQALLLCRPRTDGRAAGHGTDAGSELTVFYAPGPCPQQSALTERYIREKQKKDSVLYLSLQENAGFAERFRQSSKRDLSDLLYLCRHREGDFGMLLKGFLHEDDGLTYVPPMEQSTNAFLVPEEEWRAFFRHIRTESGFHEVVFDLEFLFPGAYALLDMCDTVYVMTCRDGDGAYRRRHFLRSYEKRFGSEKMRKLKEIRTENLPGGMYGAQ